ncbi:glutamine amidotransferase [Streptomyces radicis]|uniref:Cytoplasmic protein n=1 Tax=Streptomyces radicis TaxID=1750517 RepID=A0A3A9W7S2_9ACTN|nr:glutamine amidotransferase [Streptomyces radicis]RKN03576.1 cytoplasmic protein [Streptomyces radicis]RKN13437.1 cytoplasmic protein [Streptomyces radicis]
MKKALLLGESWTTHMIHQKGFDSFTTTEYVEGGQEFRAALESDGWQVTHLPAHTIEARFPSSAAELADHDLVVISDVGANTFLLSRAVFGRSESEPNKLERIRDYVIDGGGLLMVGGYLSFSGIDAKAKYAASPLGDILPVEVLETDDREEHPEGAPVLVQAPDHGALGGVGTEWPPLLGYNRTRERAGAQVLARVKDDPLIAVGTAGKGRTGVFTSDMSPHWAPPPFMEWPGYAPLWRALASWIAGA